ncbi:Cytochrome oxidase biogenesis protein Sco1/SenC/PrrC, thiol-disulfide reductase involved in Cu(I) insertion into CoxII Cu(A) center [hydrothermal vent metagenome]|uniref:Cytochrome oxidase biogenesis protein Sco1/SenC/PrrC, thiol-disulfide reductase involved in Cu(I) insertion into CoxII Cu(A) center n=1 Tax=hydrothermal vent metagenome TaxID=652676 RepID=A0A3B1AUY0_9ZZZZ
MPSPLQHQRLHFVLLLLIAGLLGSHAAVAKSLHVVVSIKPIHSIVSGLMAGGDQPELLVSGDANPYHYQLSKAQKSSLQKADLIIWTGVELEPFLPAELKKLNSSSRVLELLDNPDIKVLPQRNDESRRDPYFWLDSRNALILLDTLTRLLIDLDPVRSHMYVRNRSKILATLSKVDRELEYGYRGMKAGVGYLYYDTLQYFEQAYALKIRGTLLLNVANAKPDTGRLLKAHAKLNSGDYRCLLAETDVTDEQIQLLTGEAKINIGRLDSLGRQFKPGPELYAKLMRYNTQVIKQCLEIKDSQNTAVQNSNSLSTHPVGHFILVNQRGKQVTDRDMLGKYQLIYFGYTSCPDICPMSLHVMIQALKNIGDKAEAFQPYFISIDPERDTQTVVQDYVKYFDDRLIGLTGSPGMTASMAKHFRVRYEKVITDPAQPENYQMDHTSSIFIIDPEGQFVARVASNISATQMADRLLELVE